MADPVFNIKLAKFVAERNKPLFDELAEKTPQLVLILGKYNDLKYLNKAALDFHNWHSIAADVIGKDYIQTCIQTHIGISFFISYIQSAYRGEVLDHREVVLSKNGHNYFVLISSIKLESEDLLFIGEDITVQKNRESAHAELTHFLPSVFKYLPVNFFWKDKNSVFMGGDEGFLQVCGLSRLEEIKGLTDYDCPWTYIQTQKFLREDSLVYNTCQPRLNIVEETTFADKQIYHVLVSKVPLFSTIGEVMGEIGIFSKLQDASKNRLAFYLANDILQDSLISAHRKYCLPDPRGEVNAIYLSLREKQCMDEWILGKTSKEIARQLGISSRTVEVYLNNLKQKLGLSSRSELMNYYLKYQGFWVD